MTDPHWLSRVWVALQDSPSEIVPKWSGRVAGFKVGLPALLGGYRLHTLPVMGKVKG